MWKYHHRCNFNSKLQHSYNGIVTSQTDFLELRTKVGVKIGGEQTYSNIKLYGVNDVSSTNQDVEIYVDQGVQDEANKGQISIYAGSLGLNTDYHIVRNGAAPTTFYDVWAINHHENITNDYKIDAAHININAPTVHIGTISGDNAQFTDNTVTTIKRHQLNLDGQ